MELYQGKSVCEKIAAGKVFLYRMEKIQVTKRHVHDTEAEVARFHAAQSAAAAQLDYIWNKAVVEAGPDDAAVFVFHKLLLKDAEFQRIVLQAIRDDQVNAEYAIAVARDQLVEKFGQMTDRYMRARAADISDISERLLTLLDADSIWEEGEAECAAAEERAAEGTAAETRAAEGAAAEKRAAEGAAAEERAAEGTAAEKRAAEDASAEERMTEGVAAEEHATEGAAAEGGSPNGRPAVKRKAARRLGPDGKPLLLEPVILMTDEMAPSEAVLLDKSKVLAIVTRHGSADAHASILSRSMGIPSVTGIDIQAAWDGRMAIVNGENGTVIIDPEPEAVSQAKQKMQTGA